jgi:hypothetical protein
MVWAFATRRHRVGKAPTGRPLNSARVTALERTLHDFPTRANDEVIVPEVGDTFDSIREAPGHELAFHQVPLPFSHPFVAVEG